MSEKQIFEIMRSDVLPSYVESMSDKWEIQQIINLGPLDGGLARQLGVLIKTNNNKSPAKANWK